MTRQRFGFFGLSVVLLLVLLVPSVAEVSAGKAVFDPSFFVASGGDDPSPDPWGRVRLDASADLMLNVDGTANGDGGPAFAIDPVTGWPTVVWAWFDGNDHEIALSHWDGTAWSAWEMLTDNGEEDLDPAVTYGTDGSCRVTWWKGDDQQVWYQQRPPSQGWSSEERVTVVVEEGRWPAVAAAFGHSRVAYQVANADATDIVVATRQEGGWQRRVVTSTTYEGPAGDGDLHVRIHESGGRLWLDWVDGVGSMAYSEYDNATDSWSSPLYEPYTWDGAAGETEYWERESARVRVRLKVLAQ